MSSNFSNLNDGCIYSFLRDVTEDKKVENELHQHRRRLEELVARRTMQVDTQALVFESANANLSSKLDDCRKTGRTLKKYADQFADLYNNAPCGYHSLDSDGVVIQINDTGLKWLGLTREEVVGKMRFSELLTPTSRKTFQESCQRFKACGLVCDLQLEIVHKDGANFSVLLSTNAIRDAADRFVMSRSVMLKRVGVIAVDNVRAPNGAQLSYTTAETPCPKGEDGTSAAYPRLVM